MVYKNTGVQQLVTTGTKFQQSSSIGAVRKQCNYIVRRHVLNALGQVTHMVSQDMLKQSLVFRYTLTSIDLTRDTFQTEMGCVIRHETFCSCRSMV